MKRMSIRFALLIAGLAVVASARWSSASPIGAAGSIIDDGAADISEIARHVCESTESSGAQISRISTVTKLHDFFHSLPAGHPLTACSGRNHDSLHSLDELLQVSSSNVCSEESISAIEDFHHSYVTGEQSIPQILRLFFLQYASQVSSTCEKVLVADLESTVADKFTAQDYQAMENGASAKASRKILFGDDEKPDEHDDLLLLSGLIEKDTSEESVNPLTGTPVQLYMKERDVSAVNELSEKCQHRFKPVYKALVLPVIRLANLGLSESQVVTQNDLIKKWYSIAQVCEIVLSIRFIEDSSLNGDEVISITKSEAEKFLAASVPQSNEIPLEITPVVSSLGDELESVKTTDAQNLVERINSNIHARDEAMQRALKRLAATVERLPENKAFVSIADCDALDKCTYNLVDLKESVGNSLNQLANQELPSPAPKGETAKDRLKAAKKFLKDEKEALGNVAYAFKALGVVLSWTARELFSG